MRDIIELLTPQVADATMALVNALPDGTGAGLACSGLALVAFAMAKTRALLSPAPVEPVKAETAPSRFVPRPLHDTAQRDLHFDLERVAMEIYPGARLLSQVAMVEFLRSDDDGECQSLEHEHVDFLLVDARFQPFCALEYRPMSASTGADDGGNAGPSQSLKRRALRLGGVPLIEVPPNYDRDFLRERLDLLPSGRVPTPRPMPSQPRPVMLHA